MNERESEHLAYLMATLSLRDVIGDAIGAAAGLPREDRTPINTPAALAEEAYQLRVSAAERLADRDGYVPLERGGAVRASEWRTTSPEPEPAPTFERGIVGRAYDLPTGSVPAVVPMCACGHPVALVAPNQSCCGYGDCECINHVDEQLRVL